MDRRKFIGGIFAVSVGTGVLLASSGVPAKQPPRNSSDLPTYLFIVPKYSDAVRINRIMGEPRNVKITGVGGMLCGYGANTIIMDSEWDRPATDSVNLAALRRDWYRCSVLTRLYPRGKIMTSYFEAITFDYGNQCGVEMRIGESRKTLRFDKPAAKLTAEDWCQAKAKLFAWYMRSQEPAYSTFTHNSTDIGIKYTGTYPVSLCSSPAHQMHQEALSKWLAEKVDAEAFKMMTRKPI